MSSAGHNENKPFIVYCTLAAEGHNEPALQIGSHLANVGYDVTFLTGRQWQHRVEAAGMRFQSLHGMASLIDSKSLPTIFGKLLGPAGFAQLDPRDPSLQLWTGDVVWRMVMPSQFYALREALEAVRRRAGREREVLILSDGLFAGTVPYRLGAAEGLPKGYDTVPKSMGINVVPNFFAAEEAGPHTTDGFPGADEERRRSSRRLAEWIKYSRDPITHQRYIDETNRTLLMCGAMRPLEEIFETYAKGAPANPHIMASMIAHDVVLQMCIPALEFPRSSWPAHLKFGGTLPIKPLTKDLVYPAWWDEILSNSKQRTHDGAGKCKKIVMVAQGTVETDYNRLVIPTIRGLASRDDILVVAVLCAKGATLDDVFASPGSTAAHGDAAMKEPLPSNTRILDYFPYDAVLEHADVFATNSGYGGFQHAVANAVPVVQAGLDLDKREIGKRVVYAGLGLQIETLNPGPEVVAAAIDRVLGDPKYLARAQELRKEAEEFDALGTIERELEALWKKPKA